MQMKFSIIACTSQKTNSVSGGEGDESSFQNTKSAKCPRTFGDYCAFMHKEYQMKINKMKKYRCISSTKIKASPIYGPYVVEHLLERALLQAIDIMR